MHRGDAAQGVVVVHDREHTFLHLAAIPGVDDELHALGQVECNAGLGVDAEFFPVLDFGFRGIEHDEVGLEVIEFFLGRTDEHVGDEVCLPCYFHDEADGQTGVDVRAAEGIDNIEGLVGKFFVGDGFQSVPGGGSDGLVVVLVAFGCPPDCVGAGIVFDKEFIFRRAAGIDTGHNVDGAELGELSFFIAFEARFGLVDEEFVPRRIVDYLRSADAVLA